MKKIFMLILFCIVFCVSGCVTTKNIQEKELVFENLNDNFIPLKETITQTPFSDVEDFYNLTQASAKAVLYDDVVCEIDAEYDGYNLALKIDGKSFELYAEALRDIVITDIDKKDNLYEIAVFSEGSSADPSVSFIRYDGEDIIPLYHEDSESEYCSIYGDLTAGADDVYPTYGAIWTNQNGRLITSFQNIGFTSPRIALGCFDLIDNELREKTFKEPILPKKYKLAQTFNGIFTPMDKPPQNFDNYEFIFGIPFEDSTVFEKDDTLNILKMGNLSDYYSFYVDYNGQKGILAFFLGD